MRRSSAREQSAWASNTAYGNKLAIAADYYGSFRTSFTPAGYSLSTAGYLNGAVFKCPSSDNCVFP
ncbi:hypothetical protein ACH3VR_20845 [Microbacterium sp. B2969]|uniref:Uncharacterized protein n=1 Tax=Microbacterium alkaliflavum TaxID=3248839 RepID=A0ABW7QDU9_9MICO